MRLPPLTGWQRLIASLSVAWLLFVALVALLEGLSSPLHNWLHVYEVTEKDPLGLFPELVWSRLAGLAIVPVLILAAVAAATTWVRAGFAMGTSAPLLRPDRLQDVLALIQVLALDRHTHRSADGLLSELQGPPRSAPSWALVAADHPEFFRVRPGTEHGVSLVARHVLPKNDQGVRDLPADLTGKLLSLVVELHDRQLRRAKAWEIFVPVLVAVIAGAISLIGIALKP